MRRGQVSHVYRESPDQLRRLSSLPRQPREVIQEDDGCLSAASGLYAVGRPYRVIRRNGAWFVQFTENDAGDRGARR